MLIREFQIKNSRTEDLMRLALWLGITDMFVKSRKQVEVELAWHGVWVGDTSGGWL